MALDAITRLRPIARAELGMIAGAASFVALVIFGVAGPVDVTNPATSGLQFGWIFAVMVWCMFGVVRHADMLADLLGEPYGTLILTIAVIGIEVSLIAAIMLTGSESPSLARDTMLAVVMISLNGMVGLALLLGGLRHGQQEFNLEGARAFVAVLATLATMSLILPRFTISTTEPTLTPLQSAMFAAITIALYSAFLGIQTYRHRSFFVQPGAGIGGEADGWPEGRRERVRLVVYHATLLLLTMAPIVLLSKRLAVFVDHGIATVGLPVVLGGILVAALVLGPEALAAFRAALTNRLQRSVNICLGSALATIGLTVPAVLLISLITGQSVVLGLEDTDVVLLVLTLMLSILTFGGTRTNMLQGSVHLVVLLVWVVLIFSP